jgi:WD40 repeat protein
VAGLGRDGGALTFAPGGRLLATAEGTGRVLLRDVTGRRIAELPAPSGRHNVQLGASDTLTTVAFDVDGRTVSVIVGNGAVARWDVSDPARPVLLGSWTRPASGNGRVAFSPDTRVVAGAAADGSNSVSVWRLPQP